MQPGELSRELAGLRDASLFRQLLPITPLSATRGSLEGKEVRLFCTNNYLGLTHHPLVIEASVKATESYGAGAGAARLVSGHSHLYDELEDLLARRKNVEKALVFSSGYSANLGVISALAGRTDTVFCDRLAHASLVDGCILSRAKMKRFPHNDVVALERLIEGAPGKGRRLVVTEGVFSMDGDVAPLGEMADVALRNECTLMVDDANGTGVMGPGGRGTAAHLGVTRGIDIHMGTLSKAVGSIGGFVAGSKELISYLVNRARSFIYTTALPPGAVAAASAALRLMDSAPSLLERLWKNVTLVRNILESEGVNLMAGATPIMPILVGDSGKALRVSRALLEKGRIYIPAIRPPTVPEGQARLRLTVSAAHTEAELEEAARLLADLCREEGGIA